MRCFSAFAKAIPVWLSGKSKTVNLQAGFKCDFVAMEDKSYKLIITGSTLYRVFLNGSFMHYGPARGPHGYFRVDEVDLNSYLNDGLNNIAIEVAGYNCSTYYTINAPSFIQAEIIEDDKVLCNTGVYGDFKGVELLTRERKAMRYSFQRNFTEIYNLDHLNPLSDWANARELDWHPLEVIETEWEYMPREVPLPLYDEKHAVAALEAGVLETVRKAEDFKYLEHRFIHQISDKIIGFPLEEIADRPFEKLQDYSYKTKDSLMTVFKDGVVQRDINNLEYVIFDMGLNNNGFICSQITALKDSEVYFIFDEKLIDGRFDMGSWSLVNILKYNFKKSEAPYNVQSFETYGYKFIACLVLSGRIKLDYLGIKEYTYPNSNNAEFFCSDRHLNKIFDAARETYRQNTLDVFMDCSTRERGGWLCDSYFTAQSAQYFSGECLVEKVMLENFIIAKEFPVIPKGMLPMCYPADHIDSNFIPQWAMWYVIELEGYFKRSGETDKTKFKSLCYNLMEYFKKFKNSDGLLENLEQWNFIEWSKANEWVQDVNYPTNMLYSKIVHLIGTWFEDGELLAQSKNIKETIIKQSFDGTFFTDNAVRQPDGSLKPTGNRSEVCQYYAFFFEVANPEDDYYKPLLDIVLNVFGPDRWKRGEMQEIAQANAFIGNYLRMELLLRWRKYQQIIRECKGYFYKMAALTGTLWEHDSIRGSLNHGFASFAGPVLIKCMLGIKDININEKEIIFDFCSHNTSHVSGKVGTPFGDIVVKREIIRGEQHVSFTVPCGFKYNLVNGDNELNNMEIKVL